jgi:hypothetical protein
VDILEVAGVLRRTLTVGRSPATTANMYADISFEDMQDGMTDLYT